MKPDIMTAKKEFEHSAIVAKILIHVARHQLDNFADEPAIKEELICALNAAYKIYFHFTRAHDLFKMGQFRKFMEYNEQERKALLFKEGRRSYIS